MVSIVDILSGAVPLMVDVRQFGGSPEHVTEQLGHPVHGEVLVLVPDESLVDEARERALHRYPGRGWGVVQAGYVRTPTMVIERMTAAVDKGMSTFIFFPHDRGERETLELLVEEVMPAFT